MYILMGCVWNGLLVSLILGDSIGVDTNSIHLFYCIFQIVHPSIELGISLRSVWNVRGLVHGDHYYFVFLETRKKQLHLRQCESNKRR